MEHPESHDSAVSSVLFSADGTALLSESFDDETGRAWDSDAGTSKPPDWGPFLTVPTTIALSPDGRNVAVADGPGASLQLWNLETNAFQTVEGSMSSLLLSPTRLAERLLFPPPRMSSGSGIRNRCFPGAQGL